MSLPYASHVRTFLHGVRRLVILHCLKEGTKAGELCIALLDINCCHTNGRSISNADTLITQLSNHLIINITDDLVSKGAFTRCALYQAIGKQDILLILSTVKSSRCWRCRTCSPHFSVRRSQLKYDEVEILPNGAWELAVLLLELLRAPHLQHPGVS